MKKYSKHKIDLSALSVENVFYVSPTANFQMYYGIFDTDFGDVVIAAYEDKIAVVEFGSEPSNQKRITFERDDDKILQLINKKLSILLIGTLFQHKVWKALLAIRSGERVSYSQLAASMEMPTSTRAVASAVARNKIAYFVPCHRITPKDGRVGNYRWGSEIKRRLLEAEKLFL